MKDGKNKPAVLVVDDDKNTREGLERALKRDYDVYVAESAESALSLMEDTSVDILLSDVRMPGMDGITLLQRALARKSDLVCILLTAYGSVETAVEAMKRGAYDFLTKPVNLDHLDLLLKRALRSREMESENVSLKTQLDKKYGLESIIGNSRVMMGMFETIKQVAPTQSTVLIQGESGTGKELVAQALHRLSPRSHGKFVAVHCAALSPTLLESELFGHEKGAFTGAMARRQGRFELADGGTLFLDEVSEIDPAVQVKLLRAIEERSFERVGGDKTIEVDIRLITATNKDLKAMVDAGKFREDLYFRLDVVNITLPPLRERLDDVPMLCGHFISEFSDANGKQIDGITPDALNMLTAYSWPGNVRELRNTVEKMVVMTRGKKLALKDIPMNIRDASAISAPAYSGKSGRTASAGEENVSLAETEKQMILAALERNNNNRTKAAKELGISRRTLHRKLRTWDQ